MPNISLDSFSKVQIEFRLMTALDLHFIYAKRTSKLQKAKQNIDILKLWNMTHSFLMNTMESLNIGVT